MFETELKLYEFMKGFCQLMAADVKEDQLAHRAFPTGNPPGWILGHLAICTDYAAKILGGERACPRDWHVKFGPGSTPGDTLDAYPTKGELLDAYVKGHERVAEVVKKGPHENLDEPHTIEFLKVTPVQTNRDLVAHLMTTHEAMHIGQLSTWRRQMGFEKVV